MYGSTNFSQVCQNHSTGKEELFPKKMALGQLISTCKRMKLKPYLTPYTRINSKLIKNLNLRAKMINLLEKNLGVILHDLGFDNDFLGMTPKA